MNTHIDSALLAQAQDLLHNEAWLLDKQRFADWLDLYTKDATYWVPLEQDQADPFETSSIIYDDRVLLELRVQQYTHSRAHARKPLARTCHQVGNVRLLSADAAQVTVASTLVLVCLHATDIPFYDSRINIAGWVLLVGLRMAARAEPQPS